MATDLTATQYEYWYTVIKSAMLSAGFAFTASKTGAVTDFLYITKDATVADNYVTIIQYHLNLTLLDTSVIGVTSATDKVKITISKANSATLMNTRNLSYV